MIYGGLKIIHDSGAPKGVDEYKTAVIFHGFGISSEVFKPVIPYASQTACRVVLVNRRGFPGAEPFTGDEAAQLRAGQVPTPEGAQSTLAFMNDRALEIHALLAKFITDENLPINSIVLTFWSMSVVFGLAFLANAPAIGETEVEVLPYIRRVVALDPGGSMMGYVPKEFYSPGADPGLSKEEKLAQFAIWVSGYYTHDADGSSYELRTPLSDPPPTSTKIPREQLDEMMREGWDADTLLAMALFASGAAAVLRKKALYPASKTGWAKVEWRHIGCTRTVWDCFFGSVEFRKELKRPREEGEQMRSAISLLWKGANHFLHWEQPKRALQALMEDGYDDVEITG